MGDVFNTTQVWPASFKNPSLAHGPVLFQTLVDVGLYGTIVVMTAHYFVDYPTDSLALKLYIGSLFALHSLKSIQMIYITYNRLVLHYGVWIRVLPWFVRIQGLLSYLICFMIQCFFVWRLFRMLKDRRLAIIPILPMLAAIIGHINLTVIVFDTAAAGTNAARNPEPVAAVMLGGMLVADISITLLSTFHLATFKGSLREFANSLRPDGQRNMSDSLILRVLRLIWITAAPPAVAAIFNIAYYFSWRRSSINLIFDTMAPKLYGIALIYTLNARGETGRSSSAGWVSKASHKVSQITTDPYERRDASGTIVYQKSVVVTTDRDWHELQGVKGATLDSHTSVERDEERIDLPIHKA